MNNIKLYNGDCLDGMNKLIEAGVKVDLIFTSPPYNIGIKYENYNDKLEWKEYLNWCEKWLQKCYDLLKDDGRIVINHYINFRDTEKKDRFPLFDIKTIQERIGFNVSKLIVWQDNSLSKLSAWGSWLSASSPYIQTPCEGLLVSYKKVWKRKNKGVSTISKEDFIHGVSGICKLTPETRGLTKANFPVTLPQLYIELLTYKNDIVLDPFSGSGTTAIACIETEREFYGFEISQEYYKIAEQRIKEVNNKKFRELF